MNKEIKKMILVGLLLVGILIEIGIASAEDINPVKANNTIYDILAVIGAIVVLGFVWGLIKGILKEIIKWAIIILAILGAYFVYQYLSVAH